VESLKALMKTERKKCIVAGDYIEIVKEATHNYNTI
jgi:hypothetical protein